MFISCVKNICACIILFIIVSLAGCKDDGSAQPLAVANISPISGNETDEVEITGAGFSNNANENIVDFNGTNAIILSSTGKSIKVTVPENFTTGKITVTRNGISKSSSVDFTRILNVKTLAGSSQGGKNGTGTGATFFHPCAITVNADGNVLTTEFGNNGIIRMVTPERVVTTFAGSFGGIGFADGNATSARFNNPASLAFDAIGNLYVADFFNYCIRKISPQNVVSTLAGNPFADGFQNGVGNGAKFDRPKTVAVDKPGNVYVYDHERIRKVTPSGTVSTFSGSGLPGSLDGPATTARFGNVLGMVFDSASNLFICDSDYSCIRKITPDGTVSTFAGTGTSGQQDGVGTSAKFHTPLSIAIDEFDNLYVVDNGYHSIRKITSAGVVTTIVVGGKKGYKDGGADVALFNFPWGVGYHKGKLYIADYENNLIRVVFL